MYVVMIMDEGIMPEDAIVCLCDRMRSTCGIVHLHAKQPIEDQEQRGPRSAHQVIEDAERSPTD